MTIPVSRNKFRVMRTHAQALADLALGQPVEAFIVSQRSQGVSWRRIGQAIAQASGGQVDVTERTLRNWTAQVAA